MVIKREKTELRQQLLSKLLSLTKEELKRRSKNVENQLLQLSIYKKAKSILAFFPLKTEVDLKDIIEQSLGQKRWFFPVIDKDQSSLRIFEINSLKNDFAPGPLGIMQPDTGKTKEVDIGEIDLVIVPALAFDRKRNRLGRGGGFYDRFLTKLESHTQKIGVAFDLQIVEDLPVHLPFDQKVDVVISENFQI